MSDDTLSPPETTPVDEDTAEPHRHFWQQNWFVVLVGGVAIWLFCAAITALTQDPILVPSVILIGSFVAPVATVAFALSRLEKGHLSPEVIFGGFLLGGTVGVVTAALIETYLLPSSNGTFLSVGIIEEACKGLIVVAVGHYVHPRRGRDGIVLGAIVGAGFAAFESSGYAFNTIIKHTGDHEILDVLNTEATRALFAPFAHITWTALLGGAIFAASRNERFRLSGSVILTFIGVACLHGAWDASTGVGIMAANGFVDGQWVIEFPNTEHWIGSPEGALLVVWQVVYDGLLVINSLIGVSWLVHEWRRYGRQEHGNELALAT